MKGHIMTINLAEPPAFLAGLTQFDDEPVVGFRALTAPDPKAPGRVHVWGYQLVTTHHIYEFDLEATCNRVSSLHSTSFLSLV